MSSSISVCIVCRNEADKLEDCLRSATWADEIVVLDLESIDGSADVARREGARVASHTPVPIVESVRNEVAALATHDWILAMDPDERVTPGLAAELRKLAERPEIDAVCIPFMNFDFGFPPSDPLHRFELHVRMYRRSKVQWPTVPNATPEVSQARLARVSSRDDLVTIHDRNRNVPEVVDRVVRYAPLQGQAMVERGREFSARELLFALGEMTYRQFLLARPWRDGVPGLFRGGALLAFRFYVWMSFWEASGRKRTPTDDRLLRRIGLLLELPRAVAIAAIGLNRLVTRLLRRRSVER